MSTVFPDGLKERSDDELHVSQVRKYLEYGDIAKPEILAIPDQKTTYSEQLDIISQCTNKDCLRAVLDNLKNNERIRESLKSDNESVRRQAIKRIQRDAEIMRRRSPYSKSELGVIIENLRLGESAFRFFKADSRGKDPEVEFEIDFLIGEAIEINAKNLEEYNLASKEDKQKVVDRITDSDPVENLKKFRDYRQAHGLSEEPCSAEIIENVMRNGFDPIQPLLQVHRSTPSRCLK